MTRINLVPPSELYDQHLIAEYREIFMVGASLQRSINSKHYTLQKLLQRIPPRFTLNAGHVMFFYNKGYYLSNRYTLLIQEMRLRGFNPDSERVFNKHKFPAALFNDWTATKRDMDIVRQRIKNRVEQKKDYYRKTGYV